MKKLEDTPRERNTDAVKGERFAFADWITREGIQKHQIFVDEVGTNFHTKQQEHIWTACSESGEWKAWTKLHHDFCCQYNTTTS